MDQKKAKVRSILDRVLFFIVPLLGMLYIRFVSLTSRIVEDKRNIADELIKERRNVIFAFWHCRQFFLGYIRRNDKIKVLISESKDGEYIARVINYFKMDTVRGSTSRGAVKALVQSLQALKLGYCIGITPDGPKGPVCKVQKGLLMLAQKSGAPIIPLSFGAKRKKIIKSWDQYYIPYPFNKIAATYGDPIYIKSDDNLEEIAPFVEEKLNENTKRSDELAGN
ncbi:MAG: lysophospholipid acyltransferase family protein [bacterium]